MSESGRELGTSRMSDKEVGTSHRSSDMGPGISRRSSGMELGTSHRSGRELGISHKF